MPNKETSLFTNESGIDRENHKWFTNEFKHNSLFSIELKEGRLRALNHFRIDFEYPISLIAGANGCGKSTLLAIAACGFHFETEGEKKKTKVAQKDLPYFTFSDFLVQAKQEVPPSGIEITYRTTKLEVEDGSKSKPVKGFHEYSLRKANQGKWTHYSKRTQKNVEFFGIERVVPHYEKSVSKSYRKSFITPETRSQIEVSTEESVSRILGKDYQNFQLHKHAKYKLPQVSRANYTYSGFNMGAGENALFEIFYTLHACPDGSLVVIDEIELGLHASAQTHFIEELKQLCKKKKIQIIATTHSPTALCCVPPYARYYIESDGLATTISTHVSERQAAGKLNERNSEELIVYVEDEVAEKIISNALNEKNKFRTVVKQVGSNIIVARALATMHKTGSTQKTIAYIDGDSIEKIKSIKKEVKAIFENEDDAFVDNFIKSYVHFLGEKINPEKWLINSVAEHALKAFTDEFEITSDSKSRDLLRQASKQHTHTEVHCLATALNVEDLDLVNRMSRILFRNATSLRREITDNVDKHLG